MSLTKRQEELKMAHKCVDCGADVDNPERYVRCPTCRKAKLEYDRQNRIAYEARQKALRERIENPTPEQIQATNMMIREIEEMKRKAKEFNDKQKQFIKCTKCQWVTFTGSGWYCPLPYCGR